jgi:hypothetical protein
MIVVIGLLAQIAAVVAVAGVATNSGSTQPLSGSFVIFGLRRGTTARRVQPRPAHPLACPTMHRTPAS